MTLHTPFVPQGVPPNLQVDFKLPLVLLDDIAQNHLLDFLTYAFSARERDLPIYPCDRFSSYVQSGALQAGYFCGLNGCSGGRSSSHGLR